VCCSEFFCSCCAAYCCHFNFFLIFFLGGGRGVKCRWIEVEWRRVCEFRESWTRGLGSRLVHAGGKWSKMGIWEAFLNWLRRYISLSFSRWFVDFVVSLMVIMMIGYLGLFLLVCFKSIGIGSVRRRVFFYPDFIFCVCVFPVMDGWWWWWGGGALAACFSSRKWSSHS
jgi:hypothetical protein